MNGDFQPLEELLARTRDLTDLTEYLAIMRSALFAASRKDPARFYRWADELWAIPSLPASAYHAVAHTAYLSLKDYPLALNWVRRALTCIEPYERNPLEFQERCQCRQLELAALANIDPHSQEIRAPLFELHALLYGVKSTDGRLLEAMRILVPEGVISHGTSGLLKHAWADLAQAQVFGRYDSQREMDEWEALISQIPPDADDNEDD